MSKKRREIKTCYMCDQSATTREHAPPKCFFPKKKDTPKGINYREGLICVPSCNLHNTDSKKTKDDEFLQMIIVSHYGNNLVAQRDFTKRTMRAIKQRFSLGSLLTKNARPAIVDGQKTGMFEFDKERFEKAILNVARAIYYSKYKDKLTEDIKGLVLTHAAYPLVAGKIDLQAKNLLLEMSQKAEQLFKNKGVCRDGAHQEVFYYQIYQEKEGERIRIIMRMVFYEGCVIDILFDPK